MSYVTDAMWLYTQEKRPKDRWSEMVDPKRAATRARSVQETYEGVLDGLRAHGLEIT